MSSIENPNMSNPVDWSKLYTTKPAPTRTFEFVDYGIHENQLYASIEHLQSGEVVDIEFDLEWEVIDDSFDHEFGAEFCYHREFTVSNLRTVGDVPDVFKEEDLDSLVVNFFSEMDNNEFDDLCGL